MSEFPKKIDYLDALLNVMLFAIDSSNKPHVLQNTFGLTDIKFYEKLYIPRPGLEQHLLQSIYLYNWLFLIADRGSGKSTLLHAIQLNPGLELLCQSNLPNIDYRIQWINFNFFSCTNDLVSLSESHNTDFVSVEKAIIKKSIPKDGMAYIKAIVKYYLCKVNLHNDFNNDVPSPDFQGLYHPGPLSFTSDPEYISAFDKLNLKDIAYYNYNVRKFLMVVVFDNLDAASDRNEVPYKSIMEMMTKIRDKIPTYNNNIHFVIAARDDLYQNALNQFTDIPGGGDVFKKHIYLENSDLLDYEDILEPIRNALNAATHINARDLLDIEKELQKIAYVKFEEQISSTRIEFVEKYEKILSCRPVEAFDAMDKINKSYSIIPSLIQHYNYDRRNMNLAKFSFMDFIVQGNYAKYNQRDIDSLFIYWFLTSSYIKFDPERSDIFYDFKNCFCTKFPDSYRCNTGYLIIEYLHNRQRRNRGWNALIPLSEIVDKLAEYGYSNSEVVEIIILFFKENHLTIRKSKLPKYEPNISLLNDMLNNRQFYTVQAHHSSYLLITGLITQFTYMLIRISQMTNTQIRIQEITTSSNIELVLQYLEKIKDSHLAALKRMLTKYKKSNAFEDYLKNFAYLSYIHDYKHIRVGVKDLNYLLFPRIVISHKRFLINKDAREDLINKYDTLLESYVHQVKEIVKDAKNK